MDVMSRKFRSHTLPFVIGVVMMSLLLTLAIMKYHTAAESEGKDAQSSTHTHVESVQAADETNQAPVDSQASSQGGVTSSITSTTTQGTDSPTVQGSVTVNGETYTIPPSGELHHTVTSDAGQTSVNVSSQSSGSGQSYTSTSSNVQVHSQTFNVNQSTGSGSP